MAIPKCSKEKGVRKMSVNGVTGTTSAYSSYGAEMTASTAKTAEVKAEDTAIKEEAGAVYEASSKTDNAKATYGKNTELINKLKADQQAHVDQLQDIVNKLLTKQGITFDASKGLKSFYENLEVDEETRAQAQKDIAEDGYWGVDQTSSRIFDFAMALSGGDKEGMEKMKDAFLKGYDQATKAWGDKLPEISERTRDAVLKKFDDYANQEN